eukprot:TRINITY_DN30991_c0_g1_i1.p1 TRINITY_DN30991_c0_g1~~TRINITY_DN30991_c0_g1_i1.p1  ORF type:complete len:109 (+),score=21.92 TRINITY_DN30991_c0_g1_i1:81-407(+)
MNISLKDVLQFSECLVSCLWQDTECKDSSEDSHTALDEVGPAHPNEEQSEKKLELKELHDIAGSCSDATAVCSQVLWEYFSCEGEWNSTNTKTKVDPEANQKYDRKIV